MSDTVDDFHSVWSEQTTPRRTSKKLITKLFPVHLLEQLKFELHMLSVRIQSNRASRKYRNHRDLLINVGAGYQGRSGWVNVDGFSAEGVDCVFDVRKRLPFSDDSARGIFSEHFFEHLDYTEEAPQFLSECRRVLKPGGVLRLSVPDAERYLKAYAEGGWSSLAAIRPLDQQHSDGWYGWKYNTRMELINFVFRQGQQHKFAYDYETLKFLMVKCGFRQISKSQFGSSTLPELCIDQKKRETESVYVEAIK